MEAGLKIVVIGGVASGMSAAAKAKRTCKDCSVVVYTEDSYIAYSACSLPYYISDYITDMDAVIDRTPEQMLQQGVVVNICHRCEAIDPESHTVAIRRPDGTSFTDSYDRLIIATGASPVIPPFEGMELEGVFAIRSLSQANTIRDWVRESRPKNAVIIGGGIISVEMVEAFAEMGIKVTVLEAAPEIMGMMDSDVAELIRNHLSNNGVEVKCGCRVTGFGGDGTVKKVYADGEKFPADMVLVAVGVRPNSKLASDAGIELGAKNAIRVDKFMRTSKVDIWACGDCATTYNIVSGQEEYIPLGTTANKQGRIAGENAAGGASAFAGVVGTSIMKVFDMEASRTGLNMKECEAAGIDARYVMIKSRTKASAYPTVGPIYVKLVVENGTDRLLGCQIFGASGSAKRIDTVAAFVQNRLTVRDLSKLDMAYAPPFSPVWDPLIVAANQALKN